MKRPTLRKIGIEEGEEAQLKNIENIFNKIIEENFLNLKKSMPTKLQEAYWPPNGLDLKNVPLSRNNQALSIQNK